MKKSMMFAIGLVAISLISCTRSAVEKNGSDVVIKIPTSQTLQSRTSTSYLDKLLKKNSLQTLSSSSAATGFTGTNPLNCFAVFVSGPTEGLNRNHCYKKSTTSGSAISFRAGGLSQIVGYGANIELNDLESGPDRVFRLIGFHSSNGQCGDLATHHDDYGDPYIVSETGHVNLEPGTVSIAMPMTFDADKFFDRCDGPDFPDDHDDNGSGAAKKLAIQKEFFPVNQVVSATCQSVDVVAQNENGNFSSIASAISFQLVVNGVAVNSYNSYEECYAGGNSATVSMSALQSRKNVWFLAPNKGISPTASFDLSFSSNPDALTVVPLANVYVRDGDEMSFDISAPHRILTGQCYQYSIEAKYMNGSTYYGHYSSTSVSAENATIYSDSNCTTTASSISFSMGKSSAIYFKTTSPSGAKIKLSAAYSGFVNGDRIVEVGQGNTTATKMEIMYHNQLSMNDCTRASVVFLNDDHTAVPLLSGISLNLSGAGSVAKYTDDSGCMTSNSGTHVVAAGRASTEFYFEPLTYGDSILNISSPGLSTYQMNYFAKYRYKLAVNNQTGSTVNSGQCVQFDVHTQYQNSSPAYLSGVPLNISSPFPMYADSMCTAAIGSASIGSGASFTTVYFLADNLGNSPNSYNINVQSAGLQAGNSAFTVNARPIMQPTWGLSTFKIPAEYILDMKTFMAPFTGVAPFSIYHTSGLGVLTGDQYTSAAGNTATFTISDARGHSLTPFTQTVGRLAVTDFLSGSLPGGYSFSRSSSAMYYNASGTLVSASTSIARFDHNPDPSTSYASAGLLMEPARMNHTLYSSSLGNPSWNKSFANVTTSTPVPDPTGTTYSDTLEWASPTYTNMAYASSQSITPTFMQMYAGSVFVKKDTARFVGMKIHEYGASYGYSGVVLDLDTGAVVGMNDPWSGDQSLNFGVQKLKNGWFRIWTNYLAKGGSGIQLYLYPVYHGGSVISPYRDNTAVGRTYFWGAQLESGESVTSYIASAGSAGIRSADTLSANMSTVASGLISATESTLRLEYNIPEGGAQSDGVVMQFCGSGCTNNQLVVSQNANKTLSLSMVSVSGTENRMHVTPPFTTRKGINKLSVSMGNSTSHGFNWAFNGQFGTSGTDYPSYHPSYAGGAFYIGNNNSGVYQMPMHIRRLESWIHNVSIPGLRTMAQ